MDTLLKSVVCFEFNLFKDYLELNCPEIVDLRVHKKVYDFKNN